MEIVEVIPDESSEYDKFKIEKSFAENYHLVVAPNALKVKDIDWKSKVGLGKLFIDMRTPMVMCIEKKRLTMFITNLKSLDRPLIFLDNTIEENLERLMGEYQYKMFILNKIICVLKDLKIAES